jgi:hypothetical protein
MGVLTVTLDKITNLKDKDGVGRSDPYVKLELKKERLGFDKKFGNYVSKSYSVIVVFSMLLKVVDGREDFHVILSISKPIDDK